MNTLFLKKGITLPIPIEPTDAKYFYVQAMPDSKGILKIEIHSPNGPNSSGEVDLGTNKQKTPFEVIQNQEPITLMCNNDTSIKYAFK